MKDRVLDLFDRGSTAFEISEILGIAQDEVNRILRELGANLPVRDKKYRLLKAVPLTKPQRELILGCLLGNGGLLVHDQGCRFSAGHLSSELDVLLWKKGILSNLVNVVVKHNAKDASFFRTCVHNELNVLRRLVYDNNKKIISKDLANHVTPLVIAGLVSDLGWVNKTFSIRLQTTRYTMEENMLLAGIFKTFGINVKVCEGSRGEEKFYFLSFNKRNSILLYDLIKGVYPFPVRGFAPSARERLWS